MPLGSENWNVCAAGADCGDDAAGMETAAASTTERIVALEPVKPAATALAVCALRSRSRLGGTAQNAIREAGIGALHILLVGLQLGANGGIGALHARIGQEHLLARRVVALHLGRRGLGIGE